MLLSTHDPDHALLCGDRVALLHGGTLAALGAPRDVLTAEALRQVYGVDVEFGEIAVGEGVRRVCVPVLGAGPAGRGGGADATRLS